MLISRPLALATLFLASAPAFAFSLGDAAKAVASSALGSTESNSASQASALLDLLNSELNVTPKQAIGGTGALLGLAQHKLSSSDYQALSSAVPGLDKLAGLGALNNISNLNVGNVLGQLSGNGKSDDNALKSLLGNVESLEQVNSAFSSLGMDTTKVDAFTPLILQYLGSRGVSESVLGNLKGIWGVSAS